MFQKITDISTVAVLRSDMERAKQDFAAWLLAFEAQLGRYARFAVLMHRAEDGNEHKESAENMAQRKRYALWLKEHREPLQRHCVAMINICSNAQWRSRYADQMRKAGKGFGMHWLLAADEKEALGLIASLSGEAQGEAS